MDNAVIYRPKAILALGAAVLAMCLTFILDSPPSAQASQSNYCYNVTLPGEGVCTGAKRKLDAVWGQGTEHSVCVWASWYSNPQSPFPGQQLCSSGGGQAVFNGSMGEDQFYPFIWEHAPGAGTVYGIACLHCS